MKDFQVLVSWQVHQLRLCRPPPSPLLALPQSPILTGHLHLFFLNSLASCLPVTNTDSHVTYLAIISCISLNRYLRKTVSQNTIFKLQLLFHPCQQVCHRWCFLSILATLSALSQTIAAGISATIAFQLSTKVTTTNLHSTEDS